MGSLACTVSDLTIETCISCKALEEAEAQIVNMKIARNASHDRLVGRLPLEIVSRIFESYVDMHFDFKDPPFLDHRMEYAPLRLGAVCHMWRTLAWASPRLWSRISVNVRVQDNQFIPELAIQWLKRTGQLPLSICLYHDQDSKWDTSEGTIMNQMILIRVVCSLASRWETLDLLLHSEGVPDLLISQFWRPNGDERLCRLRHLRLQQLSPVFTKQLFSNFQSSPSPTYVVLDAIDVDHLDISWSNVTTFHTDLITSHSLRICHEAPCLRKLILRATRPDDHLPLEPITSPSIRSLVLEVGHVFWYPKILDSMTLQSLEDLRLISIKSSSESVNSLLSFIARSHCRLKTLHLAQFSIDDDLLRILQATPSLTYLCILFRTDIDSNVECMFKALSKTTTEFLPHLNSLDINMSMDDTYSWAWETLLDIFDPDQSLTSQSSISRKPLSLQRQSLTPSIILNGYPQKPDEYIDAESLHRISKLLEHGIVINIFYRQPPHNESQDLVTSSLAFHSTPGESSAEHGSIGSNVHL